MLVLVPLSRHLRWTPTLTLEDARDAVLALQRRFGLDRREKPVDPHLLAGALGATLTVAVPRGCSGRMVWDPADPERPPSLYFDGALPEPEGRYALAHELSHYAACRGGFPLPHDEAVIDAVTPQMLLPRTGTSRVVSRVGLRPARLAAALGGAGVPLWQLVGHAAFSRDAVCVVWRRGRRYLWSPRDVVMPEGNPFEAVLRGQVRATRAPWSVAGIDAYPIPEHDGDEQRRAVALLSREDLPLVLAGHYVEHDALRAQMRRLEDDE
jgi:hypothetical protein